MKWIHERGMGTAKIFGRMVFPPLRLNRACAGSLADRKKLITILNADNLFVKEILRNRIGGSSKS
ncbi:MAG TPA: hypothetical protein VHD35_14415 [Chitinophagaceae bacterium]|nr:hypothetical protein [Chitinophagaceae bacterium]